MFPRPLRRTPPALAATAVLALALGGGCNKKDDSANPNSATSPAMPNKAVAKSPSEAAFQSHCSRCHIPAGSGGPKGKMQGPEPSQLAGDHDRDWLIAFVKDPQSQKPESRMPSIGGKLSEDDLNKVVEYVLSLKSAAGSGG
jgi:mono/diheme cytochrome c family protein